MFAFLLLLPLLCGCAALREEAGEYAAKVAKEQAERELDKLLAARGLTTREVRNVADADNDGKVNVKEAVGLIKDIAKDYATIEAKRLVDEKIAQLDKQLVHPEQLDSKSKELFYYLIMSVLGILSTYLGKQIVSAKNDGKRDARIAMLEKALQKDLDGDGVIGDGAPPPTKV